MSNSFIFLSTVKAQSSGSRRDDWQSGITWVYIPFELIRKTIDLRARDIEHETLDSAEVRGGRPSDSSLLWVNGFVWFFWALQIDFICCAAELTLRLYFLSTCFSTMKYVFWGSSWCGVFCWWVFFFFVLDLLYVLKDLRSKLPEPTKKTF